MKTREEIQDKIKIYKLHAAFLRNAIKRKAILGKDSIELSLFLAKKYDTIAKNLEWVLEGD